jgi:hypothetical protein
MEDALAFLNKWWWLILLVVAVLAKVANLVTKHWGDHKGVRKVGLFIVDLLDLFKWTPRVKLLLPLALGASLVGCGPQSFEAALGGMHKGAKVISKIYEPELQKECMEKARACKGKVGKVEECTPYVLCRDIQRRLAAAMKGTHVSIGAVQQLREEALAAGLLKGGK